MTWSSFSVLRQSRAPLGSTFHQDRNTMKMEHTLRVRKPYLDKLQNCIHICYLGGIFSRCIHTRNKTYSYNLYVGLIYKLSLIIHTLNNLLNKLNSITLSYWLQEIVSELFIIAFMYVITGTCFANIPQHWVSFIKLNTNKLFVKLYDKCLRQQGKKTSQHAELDLGYWKI